MPKPPGQRSIADKEIGELVGGETFQQPAPFGKHGADTLAVARHPAAEVGSCLATNSPVMTQASSYQTVLFGVTPVYGGV